MHGFTRPTWHSVAIIYFPGPRTNCLVHGICIPFDFLKQHVKSQDWHMSHSVFMIQIPKTYKQFFNSHPCGCQDKYVRPLNNCHTHPIIRIVKFYGEIGNSTFGLSESQFHRFDRAGFQFRSLISKFLNSTFGDSELKFPTLSAIFPNSTLKFPNFTLTRGKYLGYPWLHKAWQSCRGNAYRHVWSLFSQVVPPFPSVPPFLQRC